jgi:hypothetical protein
MWRSVGSSMIKNTPTLNWRAVFLGLLTIALVIVAPIGHGRAQGAKPELITFTSGDLALKGFIWKPEGPGPFPAIVWNHGSLAGWSPGGGVHCRQFRGRRGVFD